MTTLTLYMFQKYSYLIVSRTHRPLLSRRPLGLIRVYPVQAKVLVIFNHSWVAEVQSWHLVVLGASQGPIVVPGSRVVQVGVVVG